MLVALLCMLCPRPAHSQCGGNSTQGTDFWFMFLNNYSGSDLSVVVAAERNTHVLVTNSYHNIYDTYTVPAQGTVTIPISQYYGSTPTNHTPAGGGIHITASSPVSIYASNFANATFDMATILPTAALRTRYISQTYTEGSAEEIGFVATEDSTVISFTLPADFQDMDNCGSPLQGGEHSVTLMRGQSYQINGMGLSGVEVTSNGKPFAMFQGNQCTFVSGAACDHLYEQCIPVDYWGNRFMLVSTAERVSGDLVLITSSADSCSLTIDGAQLAVINAHETFSYNLPTNTAAMLNASQPVTVAIYLRGGSLNLNLGDPATVIIPPVEQGVRHTTFQAFNTALTTLHYANIVTRNGDVPSIMLDSTHIGSQFTTTPSGYAYSRLSITPGTHTLSNSSPDGRFLAHFIGLGYYESYAYIAASAFIDLTERLYVDSLYTRLLTRIPQYCQGDTVHFHVESDEGQLLVQWFVDSLQEAVTTDGFSYVFDSVGDHLVQAVVHICDTLSVPLHINPSFAINVYDTVCYPETYQWYGHSFTDDTVFSEKIRTVHTGCDSSVYLNLTYIRQPQTRFASFVDCHDDIYTLSVDPLEAAGTPFAWSSTPPDPNLDGHEHDTLVHIYPRVPTLYSARFDYRCPFTVDTLLTPITWPQPAWVINPQRLTYQHPWVDAYDKTANCTFRQWFADGTLLPESGSHLHYLVSADADSLLLSLVVNSGTCTDTISCVIPFGHENVWLPTVFTPGEVTNNTFAAVVSEGTAEELFIYNRNGLLVSHIVDSHPVWDGTRNGDPCPQGAYVWLLRYHTDHEPDRTLELIGTVTLLR